MANECLHGSALGQVLRSAVAHGQALNRVGARQGRFEQLPGPLPGVAGFPHGIALDQLHAPHAGLASPPPLDHALHGLQGMKVHRVGTADADHQGLLDLAAERQLDRWQPPGDRQRRAGQKGKAQALRSLDHGAWPW